MGQAEIKIFIILGSIIVLVFVIGTIMLVFLYRNRRILYEKEKDKTEKEHQLNILNAQLESQHQTMQFIGEEIHDNVGQKLTLASLYTKQLSTPGYLVGVNEKAAAIGKIIDDSLSELRRLSKSLTERSADTGDIIALMRNEIAQVAASGICFLYVETNAEIIELPPARKNLLFRILQEFIQNSLKHSGCRRIEIKFSHTQNDLFVSASDDGKGFDNNLVSSGIGLQNIKRRTQELNGSMEFLGSPGKGVTLLLQLKVNDNL